MKLMGKPMEKQTKRERDKTRTAYTERSVDQRKEKFKEGDSAVAPTTG